MSIMFRKIIKEDIPTIFGWLGEPFIQEFWDNTQAHRDDILNFIDGRKEPSTYADGKYVYWIAQDDNQLFSLIMTIQETSADNINKVKLIHLSRTGTTYGIDYMMGNKNYFGRGYGASTLSQFIDFFRSEVDRNADTFLIDPEANNPRAKHVYLKAGFEHVADFIMTGQVSGAGKLHHLLIKKFQLHAELITANIEDYPMIQNMGRFYVYDLSRECGHTSDEWSLPSDGLYTARNFKSYFEDSTREAYIVKVRDEIAGFVLLNRVVTSEDSHWNVSEFYIIAKFQGKGIAKQVAKIIWDSHPGTWEVSVLPDNRSALAFWERAISNYTQGDFLKNIKEVYPKKSQAKRFIFTFKASN